MSDSLLSLFAPPLQLHHHHHHHYSSRHRSPPPSLAPPSPSLSLSLSISSPPPRPQKDAIFAGAFTDLNKDSSLNNEGGGVDGDAPTSLDLVPITTEEQFDRIIAEAQQLEEPLIILWMANWCRKCIYLKPKLEKLAADYYPGIRFYCVDVNTVPQRLVTRAGITKMPTIQLWRDSEKQAEVIGGQNKAWLVIDDVRRMIENDD